MQSDQILYSLSPNELKPKVFRKTYIQVVLLFFGLAISSAHGSALSVAIVAMVNNTVNPNFEEFDWTQAQRGILFSSPFWGFFITSLLSGIIAQKFGAKMPLFLVMFLKSLLVLLTPKIASIGFDFMVAKQVLEGISGGFVLPCSHTLMSKWIHPIERNTLAPTILSGSIIGSILMMLASGFIAASKIGWPGIFYVAGGMGIIWSCFWIILGGSEPSTYQSISPQEKQFLQTIPGSEQHRPPMPWKDIAVSKPFWALVISQCGESWGYVMLQSWVPTYINGILNFDIESNSIYSSLPFFIMFIIIILTSQLSNLLVRKTSLSIEILRKTFNTIGTWIPAIGLIALGFVSNNVSVAVTLLTLSIGMNAATHSGFVINHMDLTPNFAGSLVGICIAIGNIMSILSPMFAGYIITNVHDLNLWRIVFCVTAGVFFFCNGIFVIFGKAKIQAWN